MSDDLLLEMREDFALSNHTNVVSSSTKGKDQATKEALIAKSQIAMGQFEMALDATKDSPDLNMKAVSCLARLLKAAKMHPNEVVNPQQDEVFAQATNLWSEASEKLKGDNLVDVGVTLATVFINGGNSESAWALLKDLESKTENPMLQLEVMSLAVDICLRMDRLDAAKAELEAMKKVDEDATYTVLTSVAVAVSEGKQPPLGVLEDLKEKCGSTPNLLNMQALAKMSEGQWADAEKLLMSSMQQRAGDPQTLVNLITCSQHLNKSPELTERYINQLKTNAPNHPWLQAYKSFDWGE